MKYLDYLIRNTKKRKEIISKLIRKGVIKQYNSEPLIKSFIEKAEYNLNVCFNNIKLNYFDWAINASYYSIYMASQALLLEKGFTSKSHKATILLLVDFYLDNGLTKEDIELVSNVELNKEDISYFIHAKNIRENASYNPSSKYNKEVALELLDKSRDFINKIKQMIRL